MARDNIENKTIVGKLTRDEVIFPVNTLNNKGEVNMTQRKLVTVNLWDDDGALEVEHSLVHSFTNVLTEDDQSTTIQQLIVDQDVKGVIEKHNAKRVKQVNRDIQNRTGKKVNLEPVKLKNLRWEIV